MKKNIVVVIMALVMSFSVNAQAFSWGKDEFPKKDAELIVKRNLLRSLKNGFAERHGVKNEIKRVKVTKRRYITKYDVWQKENDVRWVHKMQKLIQYMDDDCIVGYVEFEAVFDATNSTEEKKGYGAMIMYRMKGEQIIHFIALLEFFMEWDDGEGNIWTAKEVWDYISTQQESDLYKDISAF